MEEKVRKCIECHTKHDCDHCPYNKSDIMLDPRIDPDYGRNVIEAVRKCRDELIDDMGKVIEDQEERISIMEESCENKLNHHEVACIIADMLGDTCACNFNGNDEWLPYYCDFVNTCCPSPVGVACWEQYLKHLDKKQPKGEEA